MYVLDNYNGLDFLVLSLYLASYALRFLVDFRVREADAYYNGTTSARAALAAEDYRGFIRIRERIFDDTVDPMNSYFMRACKSQILNLQYILQCSHSRYVMYMYCMFLHCSAFQMV